MATHDYVIDNSTGANVRADINLVLQAILTNNSSSSAPSTTAAYMWWADTNTGVLKIRNSANNDWVELLQLDGTLTLEDGTNSAPALAFRDDLDTGIYSSAANTFNIATGGTERLELGTTTIFNESGADVDFRIEGDTEANLFYVDAGNDRIGIGTSSPDALLTLDGAINPTIVIKAGGTTRATLAADTGSSKTVLSSYDGYPLEFSSSAGGGGNTVMTLLNSGNVGIGTTSPLANSILHVKSSNASDYRPLVVEGSATSGSGISIHNNSAQRIFIGSGGGNNLSASSTADGLIRTETNTVFAVGNSEKVRIDSSGNVGIGTTSPAFGSGGGLHLRGPSAGQTRLHMTTSSSGDTASDGFDVVALGEESGNSGGVINFIQHENKDVKFTYGGTAEMLKMTPTASVELFENGAKKLETTGSGVTVTGTVVETSDIALKSDIQPLTNTLEKIQQITGYKYNLLNSISPSMGVIAQDVEKVFPELVHGTEGKKTLQYSGLIGVLVEAVKDLSAKVAALEAG